ncbi:MAG: amidohydrolase family protein [Sphingomonadaceae bacterium]
MFATQANANSHGALVIDDVKILHLAQSEHETVDHRSILIENGLITRIAPFGEIKPPNHARIVEGKGRLVMAGLVDMHVHVWDRSSLGAYLASGVTTIRNASGMPFHLRLADQIDKGEIIGPRLITTGPILNSPGPNAQINHEMVATAREARDAVRRQHADGFRRIKVYSNLTREAYEAIHEEASRLGMTIMGHTPEGARERGMPESIPFNIAFEELLDDGFVTIEHVESIVWHGLRDRHDDAAAKRLASKISSANVAVDPTLLAFYNLLKVAETKGDYLKRPGTETLNPLLVAQSQAEYDRWSQEDVERNRAAFEFYKRMTRFMFDEGVLLVAGSDSGIFTNVPGASLLKELDLMHEAGIDPTSVLRTATINAAAALNEAKTFGRVAEGHRADLLLLDSDPTKDLAALRSLSAVIANGRLLDRAQLDQLQSEAAEHNVERTQRNLVEALSSQGSDVAKLGL